MVPIDLSISDYDVTPEGAIKMEDPESYWMDYDTEDGYGGYNMIDDTTKMDPEV